LRQRLSRNRTSRNRHNCSLRSIRTSRRPSMVLRTQLPLLMRSAKPGSNCWLAHRSVIPWGRGAHGCGRDGSPGCAAAVSIHGGSDVAAGHSLAGCPTGVSGVASLQVRGTPEWTPAAPVPWGYRLDLPAEQPCVRHPGRVAIDAVTATWTVGNCGRFMCDSSLRAG
jgi:hypothetical protein